jgi:hypothetical protein
VTACQEAAERSSWDRWVDRALSIVADGPEPAYGPLVAIEGTRPAGAPAESRHPSLRGRKPEGAA